jgi:hypothetical protein
VARRHWGEEGPLEGPEQEARHQHIAQRRGDGGQGAEAMDGRLQHQMGCIEAGRAGHAEDSQARHQKGEGQLRDAVEQSAQSRQGGGVGAAVDQASHEQHGGGRQAEGHRQQQAALEAEGVEAEQAEDDQGCVADHGEGDQGA